MSDLNAAADKHYDAETRRLMREMEEWTKTPDPAPQPEAESQRASPAPKAETPAGATSAISAAPPLDRSMTRTWGEAPAAAWEGAKHAGKMFAVGVAGMISQAVGGAGMVALPKFVRDQIPDLGVTEALGLRTNVDPSTIRKNLADGLEGFLGLVGAPFEIPLQAISIGVDKLLPEQVEHEVLPGGKGSLAGSLRRLINAPIPGSDRSLSASAMRLANVPHQIAQGIRGEGWNPTPEEAEYLDAPMTLGEFSKNLTLVTLMTRAATTTGARTVKTMVEGVKEGIPQARAERAAAKVKDAEAEAQATKAKAQETVAEPLPEGPVPAMYEKARAVMDQPDIPADLVTRAVVETLLEPDITKLPDRLSGMLRDTGLDQARANDLGPKLAQAFADGPGVGLLANRLDLRPRLDVPRVPDRNPALGALGVKQLITDMTARVPKIVEASPDLKAAEGSGMTYTRLFERDLRVEPLSAGEVAGARSLEAAAAEHVTGLADRVLTGQGRPGELVQALLLLAETSRRVAESTEKPRFRVERPDPAAPADLQAAANRAGRELAAQMTKEGATRPEINDAIRALKNKMGVLSQTQQAAQAGGKLVQIPTKGAIRRAEMNEQIARMAENFDPAITDQGLGHLVSLVNEVHGPPGVKGFSRLLHNWGQAGISTWYASVLSAKAPVRAAVSNAMLSFAELAVSANAPYMPKGLWRVTMDEGWSAPGVTPRGAAKFVAGALIDPVMNRPGMVKVFKKYQESHPDLDQGRLWELVKHSAMRPEKLLGPGAQQGGLATAINWADYVTAVPFRLLNGADLFLGKYPLFSGKARELSWRQAEMEIGPKPKGLKAAAEWEAKMAEREAHYMGNLDKLDEPFQAELRRVPEEATMSNPPDLQFVREAIEFLNSRPGIATGLLRIQTLPFARTVLNAYETFAAYTPGLNLASARFWNTMKGGGAPAQRAWAQLDVGLGVYSILTGLVEEGAWTGDGPLDPAQRRHARFAEGPPRSVRVPGTDLAVQYRGTAIEPMLAFVANAHRALGAVDVETSSQFGKVFALAFADTLSAFDFLELLGTFSDLFDTSLAPDKRLAGPTKAIAELGKIAGAIAAPGALREIRQTVDPTRRETFTPGSGLAREAEMWLRGVFNSTPGLSTATDAFGQYVLPPRRDPLFGDEDWEQNIPFMAAVGAIPAEGGLKERVWSEVLRVGARVTPGPDFLIAGSRGDDALTPEQENQPRALPLNLAEQDRLTVLMTQEIKDSRGRNLGMVLDDMIDSAAYQRQSKPTQAQQIELRVNQFRDVATKALRKENRELQREWELVEGDNRIREAPPERQPELRQRHRERVKNKYDLRLD